MVARLGWILVLGWCTGAFGQEAGVASDLRKIQDAARVVAPRAMATTVAIKYGPGHGSGVLVSADGYVLTAAHCFPKAGVELTVVLPGGQEVPARGLGREELHDFGLVKITEPGEYPFAPMGTIKGLARQVPAFATGNPWEIQNPAPLRFGIVLKTPEHGGRFIRSTCKVAPGDSGGPLWDLDGNILGIHSFISSSVRHNYHAPVDRYRDNWERLVRGDEWNLRPEPPGPEGPDDGPSPEESKPAVEIPDVPPSAPDPCDFGLEVESTGAVGVRVRVVSPGGPGEKAGLVVGDVILRVAGRTLLSEKSFDVARRRCRVGLPVTLTIRRGEEELKRDLVPEVRP